MTVLPQETELKLWLHPDDVDAFLDHPRLKRARPVRLTLHTLYFDTPDLKLAKKGVALRVRKAGRRWLQTLKTEGERSGGLSKRLELETPVGGPALDFTQFPEKIVDKLIPAKRRAKLSPVYETRFVRTAWNLRTPEGSCVEVALDVGEIIAGTRRRPICEVELELKSGKPDALFELAGILAQKILLIPYEPSKAARGAQLAAGLKPQPVKAISPILQKKMPVCSGFAAILLSDLSQLQANLPGLLLESDPEYCHQARVAIRRLRSAARLFRKLCPVPDAQLAEIAALGDALGRLRDADVFVLETLPRIQAGLSPEQFGLLSRRAKARRRAQREATLAAVHSPATGACLIALQKWLIGMESASTEVRLDRYAAGKLEVLFDRIAMSAGNVAHYSADERHALRVLVKRLRYACEHFSTLISLKKPFLSDLAALQGRLGMMNDEVVALNLIAEMNTDGHLNEAQADIKKWVNGENSAGLSLLGECLQLFSRNRPIW